MQLSARNQLRADRSFGPHVVRQQHSHLWRSLRGLGKEGFRHVHVLERSHHGHDHLDRFRLALRRTPGMVPAE